MIKILLSVAERNVCYFAFVIPGVIWFVLGKGKKWLERFTMLALCFFLFLGIYVGGAGIGYYALPLSVFAVLGFAWIAGLVEKLIEKMGGREMAVNDSEGKYALKVNGRIVPCLISMMIALAFIWNASMNIPFMSMKAEDHFLFKFKNIVTQVENPTVMNYGSLDTGLATVTGAMPAGYWFQTQTLPMDEIEEDQLQCMRDGVPKFVISRDHCPDSDSAMANYEVVSVADWDFYGDTVTYYLLERKDLIK